MTAWWLSARNLKRPFLHTCLRAGPFWLLLLSCQHRRTWAHRARLQLNRVKAFGSVLKVRDFQIHISRELDGQIVGILRKIPRAKQQALLAESRSCLARSRFSNAETSKNEKSASRK